MNTADGVAIAGAVALVTGANRGLGNTFLRELLGRGAAKVYAAARNPDTIGVADGRVIPIGLDVTKPEEVHAAAERCADVSILINNAGVMLRMPLLAAPDRRAARDEMETNYFGTLQMCRAFAPVLARQCAGALVNIVSVASWLTSPFNGSYGASKSALWALTNAARIELRSQGTLVVAVHAGWIDTDMAATVSDTMISPRDVATQTLDAVEHGDDEVLTDAFTREVKAALSGDHAPLYSDLQKSWDTGNWPWQRGPQGSTA